MRVVRARGERAVGTRGERVLSPASPSGLAHHPDEGPIRFGRRGAPAGATRSIVGYECLAHPHPPRLREGLWPRPDHLSPDPLWAKDRDQAKNSSPRRGGRGQGGRCGGEPAWTSDAKRRWRRAVTPSRFPRRGNRRADGPFPPSRRTEDALRKAGRRQDPRLRIGVPTARPPSPGSRRPRTFSSRSWRAPRRASA